MRFLPAFAIASGICGAVLVLSSRVRATLRRPDGLDRVFVAGLLGSLVLTWIIMQFQYLAMGAAVLFLAFLPWVSVVGGVWLLYRVLVAVFVPENNNNTSSRDP